MLELVTEVATRLVTLLGVVAGIISIKLLGALYPIEF